MTQLRQRMLEDMAVRNLARTLVRPTCSRLLPIFRQAGPAYRQQNADTLNREQRRVMGAIERCRTAVLGGHAEQCDVCGHQRIAYNSYQSRCQRRRARLAYHTATARLKTLCIISFFIRRKLNQQMGGEGVA